MAGWFLDVLVAYLIRVVVRFVKARRSASWIVCKGTVTTSKRSREALECELAEITYLYRVDGEPYAGTNQKPFLSSKLADIHVAWFPPGSEITVRVNPADHQISIVRDADQSYTSKQSEMAAT